MSYRAATEEEKERFSRICEKIALSELSAMKDYEFDKKHRRIIKRSSLEGDVNIGGLSEKGLHLSLKYFFDENREHHEVKVGSHFADIFKNGQIIEIQTRNFCSFRKKLACVSESNPVLVVHPIIKNKAVYWLEPESRELKGGRKSPKHGDIYDAFRELVYIRELLQRESLSFCFPILECDEVRLLCGWDNERKKGAIRYSLIPKKLLGFYEFDTAFAFATLLPQSASDNITVASVSKQIGKDKRLTSAFLNVLLYLDILGRCRDGKRGYRYFYGENY